jgi:hypothetical protein
MKNISTEKLNEVLNTNFNGDTTIYGESFSTFNTDCDDMTEEEFASEAEIGSYKDTEEGDTLLKVSDGDDCYVVRIDTDGNFHRE